eukprot:1511299-Rhodomonas_salina.1
MSWRNVQDGQLDKWGTWHTAFPWKSWCGDVPPLELFMQKMREQEQAGIVHVSAQYAVFAGHILEASDKWAAAQRVWSPLLNMAPEDVCTQWKAMVARHTESGDDDLESWMVEYMPEVPEAIVDFARYEIDHCKTSYERAADEHQRRTARPYPQRQ